MLFGLPFLKREAQKSVQLAHLHCLINDNFCFSLEFHSPPLNTDYNKTPDSLKFISLLRNADAPAMEMIYNEFAPVLYGVILKITGNEGAAEDILKDTFLYISNHNSQFDESKENLSLWMIGIARKIAHLRISFEAFLKNQNTSTYVDKPLEIGKNLQSGTAVSENGLMTTKQRKVLDLIFFGGGKINEVAKTLCMDETEVKKLLREALNHYRKELQQA